MIKNDIDLRKLTNAISECNTIKLTGKVTQVVGLVIETQGPAVSVGELCYISSRFPNVPPIPAEVEQYEPWQRRRLSMRSGCTCLWQVGGRNALDFEDWMRLDLKYIDTWSLSLDLKIIAKTFGVMFRGTGY